MKKKLIDFIKSLNFTKTIVILFCIVVVIFVLDRILFPTPETTTQIGHDDAGNSIVDFDYKERLGYTNEGDPTKEGVSSDAFAKGVLSVMPFHNDKFTITYQDGVDKFTVQINPASGATAADVYKWFGQFSDVPDPAKLNIEFVDTDSKGAPVIQ